MKHLFIMIICLGSVCSENPPEGFDDIQKINLEITKGASIDSVDTEVNRLKQVLNRSKLGLLTYKSDEFVLKNYPNAQIHTTPEYEIKFISIIDSKLSKRYILIRGNSNFKNWAVSLDAELVKGFLGDIGIHRGFLKGTIEVYDSLLFQKLLKSKTTRNGNGAPTLIKNVLVGHSMGGAVAVLLAKKMQLEGHEIEEVITFSQPMITDSKGVKLMNTLPLLRVGLDRDVVVYLPTTDIGYKHMGQKLEIDSFNYKFFDNSNRDNTQWEPPETRPPLEPRNPKQTNQKPYFGLDLASEDVSEFMAAHSLDVYAFQLHGHIKKLSEPGND